MWAHGAAEEAFIYVAASAMVTEANLARRDATIGALDRCVVVGI
jgi:hypothetical protein